MSGLVQLADNEKPESLSVTGLHLLGICSIKFKSFIYTTHN